MKQGGIVRAALAVLMLCSCGLFAGSGRAAPVIEKLSNIDEYGRLAAGPVKARLTEYVGVVLGSGVANQPVDPDTIDATRMVLVLDGRPISGLKYTIKRPDQTNPNTAIVFRLIRNADNKEAWQPLLEQPNLALRSVSVSLWAKMPAKGSNEAPEVIAWSKDPKNKEARSFDLELITVASLFWGIVAVLLVLVVVWIGATRTTALKDSLLPQLAPDKQPFSLGRTQMAFWFVLVFASYVFLYCLMWDYNTVTAQTLSLMGLSAATAVFAIAIDAAKDSPIGQANEALRTIGIKSYDDVVRLQGEIEDLKRKLTGVPAADAPVLAAIQDRLTKLDAWRDLTGKFQSDGFFRDLTTDLNGPALHRLQIVVWTLTLGVVFVIDVYRTLAMPEFSTILLALMGVTSAGYLGFKYPEKQA
jgi:hypothetical protein